MVRVTAVSDCSHHLFTSPLCLHAPSQKDNDPLLNRKITAYSREEGLPTFLDGIQNGAAS